MKKGSFSIVRQVFQRRFSTLRSSRPSALSSSARSLIVSPSSTPSQIPRNSLLPASTFVSSIESNFSTTCFLPSTRSLCSSAGGGNGVVVVKSEEEFINAMSKAEGGSSPSIFYFTAVWCGPCMFIAPVIEELSKQYPDVTTYKIDIDEGGLSNTLSKLSITAVRTFPFDLMKSLPKEDLSNKMVIIAKWGSSWEVDISKNPRFYYMEKSGWNQFVRDNALGKNEFVTFTHKGSMCFDVNIYGKDEKEITIPNLFKKHIPNEQTMFTIHSKGSGGGSWEVWCLVREAQATFSRGWSKLAREYPLEIGDKCTLQLIKPNECVLTISNKGQRGGDHCH
ncbi:unnamed protein product [Brassica napus]|uniref:(rape) hypothetical protein n=1 Tax=Brassica napus TaxID=3708 RepID=A0A817AX87_BRANA|nr:unnamed protein product [Brassica napus]